MFVHLGYKKKRKSSYQTLTGLDLALDLRPLCAAIATAGEQAPSCVPPQLLPPPWSACLGTPPDLCRRDPQPLDPRKRGAARWGRGWRSSPLPLRLPRGRAVVPPQGHGPPRLHEATRLLCTVPPHCRRAAAPLRSHTPPLHHTARPHVTSEPAAMSRRLCAHRTFGPPPRLRRG